MSTVTSEPTVVPEPSNTHKRSNTLLEDLEETDEILSPLKRSRCPSVETALEAVGTDELTTHMVDYHFTNLIKPIPDQTLSVPTNVLTILMDLDECLMVGSDGRDYNTWFQFSAKPFDWQVNFTQNLLNPEAIKSLQYIKTHLKPGMSLEINFYTSKGGLVPLFRQQHQNTQHVMVPGDTTCSTCLSELTWLNKCSKDGIERIFIIRDAFAQLLDLPTPPTMIICAHMMPWRACTKVVHHAAWMLGRHPDNCVLIDNTKVYFDLTEFNPLGSVIHIEDYHYLGPEQAQVVRQIFVDHFGEECSPTFLDIDPSLHHMECELRTQCNIQCGCYDAKLDKIIIEEAPLPSWEGKILANERIMRFLDV